MTLYKRKLELVVLCLSTADVLSVALCCASIAALAHSRDTLAQSTKIRSVRICITLYIAQNGTFSQIRPQIVAILSGDTVN